MPGTCIACGATAKAICKPCWFRLPLPFRRRWWAATDYGAHPPSQEMRAEALNLLQPHRQEPTA